MIRGTAYTAAVATAAELAAKGVAMVGVPGTLISDLVAKSAVDPEMLTGVAVGDQGNDRVLNYGILLSMATDDGAGEPSQHSMAMGSYVDSIANVVSAHIAYARNTVKPLVMDLAAKLESSAQNLRNSTPSADVELVVENIPEVLKDESFLDTLKYFQDRSPVEPKKLELSPKSNEDVRALIPVGSQRVDEMIAGWASRMPEDFFRKIWASYFGVDRDVWWEPISELSVFGRLNHYLGVYLVARKIMDEVQDDAKISLAAYKDICIQIRDYAGAMLAINLKAAYQMTNNKMLVTGFYPTKKCITVNGELYAGWLATGGKPEIILGMLADNNRINNIALIDEKAQQLERAWNTYVMLKATQSNNTLHDRMRLAIISDFTSQMGVQDEAEQQLNAVNGQRVENAIKAATEYVATLKGDELFCCNDLALKLVAGVRFCHTSAFQILNDINEASKVNPNVDVREAATLAVINYLADWLADQVTLKA